MIQRVLKENVNRTVRLECREREDGRLEGHVVKQFHGARLARRLFDGRRARRELQALKRARAAGLPAPAPVGVRRSGKYWELVTEFKDGAIPFRLLLEGFAPWPVAPGVLARRLGELFARIVAVGLEHSDLHAGNVLIDDEGMPCLIDLGKAQFDVKFSPRRIEADLVTLAADVRERVSAVFRTRFLHAFLKGLPPEIRANLPEPTRLAERITAEARRERRRILRHARLRWTRESSAARPLSSGGLRGFVRRGLDDSAVIPLLEFLDAGSDPDVTVLEFPAPNPPHQRIVLLLSSSFSDLRENWYSTARVLMHGLKTARPLCLVRTPRPFAAFELPAEADDFVMAFETMDATTRRRTARALGALVGALHDRGLDVRELGGTDVYAAGTDLFFGPGIALDALADGQRVKLWSHFERIAGETRPLERAAFAAAYVREQRDGPAARRRIAEELRRG